MPALRIGVIRAIPGIALKPKVTFCVQGEITPPCGVPQVLFASTAVGSETSTSPDFRPNASAIKLAMPRSF
jgi:hypothetical protein